MVSPSAATRVEQEKPIEPKANHIVRKERNMKKQKLHCIGWWIASLILCSESMGAINCANAYDIDLALKSVKFTGVNFHSVYPDSSATTPYVSSTDAQWQDNQGTDNDVNAPLCFTKGSSFALKLEAKWEGTSSKLPDGTYTITGTSNNSDVSITANASANITRAAGVVTVTITDVSVTLNNFNKVRCITNLKIDWSLGDGDDNIAGSCALGSSTHQVYVTLANPNPAVKMHHTTVHVACDALKGETSSQNMTSKIWAKFTQKNIGNHKGSALHYYDDWQTQNDTTISLLKNLDGTCDAWVKFFIDLHRVHGNTSLTSYLTYRVGSCGLRYHPNGFMIKKWDTQSQTGTTQGYPCKNTYLGSDLNGHILTSSYNWQSADITDVVDSRSDNPSYSGQNVDNPVSHFGNHKFVKVGTTYFDPSYGKSYANNLNNVGTDMHAVCYGPYQDSGNLWRMDIAPLSGISLTYTTVSTSY